MSSMISNPEIMHVLHQHLALVLISTGLTRPVASVLYMYVRHLI